MISIITAIYNQKAMNELYMESLKKYTVNKFELIILDNGSTDGSAEYFEKNGAKVIRNGNNYSYPFCQNKGIEASSNDILAFFNNDIIVSPGWDEKVINIMTNNNIEIATCAATDCLESLVSTYRSQKKWKFIRNPLLFLFGGGKFNLKLMFFLMYGNWETFTKNRNNKFHNIIKEGVSGSNVIMTKSAIEKVGRWDERMQCADFDLFLRTKKRSLEKQDIKPVQILCGIYFHHFIRLTVKAKYPPFADKGNLINLTDKWNYTEAKELIKDSDLVI